MRQFVFGSMVVSLAVLVCDLGRPWEDRCVGLSAPRGLSQVADQGLLTLMDDNEQQKRPQITLAGSNEQQKRPQVA